jgi:hypothetical protein
VSFQEVVQLVTGFALGAAGAPDVGIGGDHADFVCGLFTGTAANADGAIDQRKLVIFLKENHHAIGQLNAPWLLRLELVQWWDRNLLPGVGGGAGAFWRCLLLGGRGFSCLRGRKHRT